MRIPRFLEVEAQQGDTIKSLAKTKLGSEDEAQLLFEANVNVIDRPEDLKPGMRLRVPLLVEAKP